MTRPYAVIFGILHIFGSSVKFIYYHILCCFVSTQMRRCVLRNNIDNAFPDLTVLAIVLITHERETLVFMNVFN